MADSNVSKPYVWTSVPSKAVNFRTATRQYNGVSVELELDKTKTTTWRSDAAEDPDQETVQMLRVQSPKFRKFSVKEWPAKKPGDRVSYSGSFTLGDLEGAGLPAKFVRDWVRPLEERVVQTAADRSIEWFKKEKKVADLERMITSSVNEGGTSKEGREYGPLMKCKIPFQRGQFQCQFYKGDSGKPSSLAEYLEASEHGREQVDCVAILDYKSVWFMGKDFGVTPVLNSLLYWPQDRLTRFSFISDPASGTDNDRSTAEAFLDDGPVAKRQKLEAPKSNDGAEQDD